MFCTSCGSKLPDNARFCTSCGTPVTLPPVPVAVPSPAPVEEKPTEPIVELPVVEAPVAEEVAVAEPAVEDVAVEEVAVEAPVAEEPAIEEIAPEKPAVEEAVVVPVVVEPTIEPTVEPTPFVVEPTMVVSPPAPTPVIPTPVDVPQPPVSEPIAVDTAQIAAPSVRKVQRLLSLCSHPLTAIAAVLQTLFAFVLLIVATALPVMLFVDGALEIFVDAETANLIADVLLEGGSMLVLFPILALFVCAVASIMKAIGAWATLSGGYKAPRTAANGCLVVQIGSYLSVIGAALVGVMAVSVYSAYLDIIDRDFGLVYNAEWIVGFGAVIGAVVLVFFAAKQITLGSLAWRMQRNLRAACDEKHVLRAGGTGTASLHLVSAVAFAGAAIVLLMPETLTMVEAILAAALCLLAIADAVVGALALVHYGATLRLIKRDV